MRAVIQRVTEASVTIEGRVKGSIHQGLVVLVAVEESDAWEDVEWLSGKIGRMRIFGDSKGLMNLSVQDIGGELLVISQFTLFASTKKGNRPSYTRSSRPEVAIPIYEQFLARLGQETDKKVQLGEFGADMEVTLCNDGPVTIFIDSKQRE
jgi:D-tyrosyl-tRNA(Tyr) deacylase